MASTLDVVLRELAEFWSRNFATEDASLTDVNESKGDDEGISDADYDEVDEEEEEEEEREELARVTSHLTKPRRSSGYSMLLLPLAVYWTGQSPDPLPADALEGISLSDANAGGTEHQGHHSHAPSLDFEHEDFYGSMDEDQASLTLDALQNEEDENAVDGATLLAKYLLFDVLGDQDPKVVSMFSAAVAKLEAFRRRMTSPTSVPEQAVELSESSAVQQLGDCTGGVYRLGDNAIFKPRSQEAMQKASFATGDPSPLRKGFLIGDGAIREVAAYQLDRAANHFARVPPTTLTSVRSDVLGTTTQGPRLEGSLQLFTSNVGSSEDFGSSSFRLRDIQAIALLDIRMFNTDRHGGNLLVSNVAPETDGGVASKQHALVPIDHGLCLPDFHHLGEFEAEWLYWRQARQPLSEEARAHVKSLDAERDAKILRNLGLRDKSILTMRLMTRFLKFAVLTLNWNLHEIGVFMTRSYLSTGGDDEDASGCGPCSKFELLLRRAAARSGDASLPGFLRGDGSVDFSERRAQALLVAAENQWTADLEAGHVS